MGAALYFKPENSSIVWLTFYPCSLHDATDEPTDPLPLIVVFRPS